MYLNNLLGEIYPDKEAPIELLKKYDLEGLLEKSILKINAVLERPPVSPISLIPLAPSILLAVNIRLKFISDPNHKILLEILIADVASYLIEQMVKKSDRPATALKELKISLENASDLEGYNFQSLLSLLRYDYLETTYSKDKPIAIETFGYDWKGKPHDLDLIAKKLYKQNSIKSIREFRELFSNHNNPALRVMFSKDSLPFLFILFDELKRKKLIIPKGCNGHFHPLRVYGMDFEKKILIASEPKLIKAGLKRDPEKLAILQNKANEWLNGITPRVTSKLPLASQRKINHPGV